MNDLSLYWISLFLVLSAFFSASETALFSLSKVQQKKLENSNKKSDKRVLRTLAKPRYLLIAILLGNTLVNISISSFSTVYSLYLKEHLHLSVSNSLLIAIQIFITTVLILLFGETIPKLIAWVKAYEIARIVSLPLQTLMILLWPLLKTLDLFSVMISKRQGRSFKSEITQEEFQTLIHSQTSRHNLEEHEKKILTGLFRLPKAEIREIIIPRVHIVAIDESATINGLKNMIIESGYSRIPVYRETIDNIVGIAYAKDILLHPEVKSIQEIMRKPWFVTENMKIQNLLNQFKNRKTQVAIVVDEYGGTSGLITLEDIMEELVGEIKDEYDTDELPIIERIDNTSIIVNGMFAIREINSEFNIDIDPNKYDNIADYLLEYFNCVPKTNDQLSFKDKVKFTIIDSNKKRINKIQISKLLKQDEEV